MFLLALKCSLVMVWNLVGGFENKSSYINRDAHPVISLSSLLLEMILFEIHVFVGLKEKRYIWVKYLFYPSISDSHVMVHTFYMLPL